MNTPNTRELKGLAIHTTGNQIRRINSTHYKVRSQSQPNKWYLVTRDKLYWACECSDHIHHHVVCKHILAVQYSLGIRRQTTLDNFGFQYQEKEVFICENCGSSKIIKRGFRKTKFGKIQRYSCKNCKHRFVIKEGYQRMKHDPKLITIAMDLYFKGVSYRDLVDHILQFYGIHIWQSTLYYWIRKYVTLMKNYLNTITPNVSGVWHVDETMVNVRGAKMGKGHYLWLWSVIDRDTKMILASQIHKNRHGKDAREVLSAAREKTKRLPAILVTDSHHVYPRAFNKEIKKGPYPQPEHLRASAISKGENMLIERWFGTLKQRTKIMRGMNSHDTAQLQADGFGIYYNCIRNHSSLGMTPVEKANINLKLGQNRWFDLIRQSARYKEFN